MVKVRPAGDDTSNYGLPPFVKGDALKEDVARIVHGVLIDPTEDSTSDNLRGLAELLDLGHEADLDTNLGVLPTGSPEPGGRSGLVLRLEVAGSLEKAASAARRAAELAIYPDIGVESVGAAARTNKLLEGTVGILVKPVETLETIVETTTEPEEAGPS